MSGAAAMATASAGARVRRTRRIWIGVLSVALFVFVWTLRFNTLGGALGGFDDDHFVPFGYAKQVQAGDQPLRDFAGIGLQGVWPSLTFELSAMAQTWLGNQLRSEALLTVTGIATAAVLTFLAAVHIAPIWIAMSAAMLGAFLGTRLYNYPKVLVLGAAVLVIARYAQRASLAGVAALAVVTVVGFLFRHDFAIYVGIGSIAVMIAAAGSIRTALAQVGRYTVIVVVLLTPSLIVVQRYAGLRSYLQDSLISVNEESARTERRELSFVASSGDGRRLNPWNFFDEEPNAVKWLFYVSWVLPLVAVVIAVRPSPQWRQWRPALVALALMAFVLIPAFLRGNTAARFGDMAPVTAVLFAASLAWVFREDASRRALVGGGSAAVVLMAATVQSVWAIGGVTNDLDVSGWSHSPAAIVSQSSRRWAELQQLPRAYWAGTPESPSIAAVQYLHACTRPSDRVLVISYQPELLPLADRRFAGGRASVIPGLVTDDDHQRQLIRFWERQSVPIVLVEPAEEHAFEIPILYKHLIERYVDSGPLPVNGGTVLHVYAERSRQPSGAFGPSALPCFQ